MFAPFDGSCDFRLSWLLFDIGSGPAIGARKDPRSAPCIGADLSPYGWPVLTQQYLPLLATFPGLNFDGYR